MAEKFVYGLWHMRPIDPTLNLNPEEDYFETDDKLCGIFSTEHKAKEAQRSLVEQPGFRDYPDAFFLAGYELDKMEWVEGFTTE